MRSRTEDSPVTRSTAAPSPAADRAGRAVRPVGAGRRRDATANRAALLVAAQSVLARDPHASLDAIAQSAGLSRRALYGHFSDRESLLREVIAIALKRSAGDGTVFAGDPRDLALEITPRLTLQQGLTPEMVQTIVDSLNGDWRSALKDSGEVVRVLAGSRRERAWRKLRNR